MFYCARGFCCPGLGLRHVLKGLGFRFIYVFLQGLSRSYSRVIQGVYRDLN